MARIKGSTPTRNRRKRENIAQISVGEKTWNTIPQRTVTSVLREKN